MDTIIYLILNKNNTAPDIIVREKAGAYRLLLVKVGGCQKQEERDGSGKLFESQKVEKEQSMPLDENENAEGRYSKVSGGWRLFFKNRKMAKQNRKQEQQNSKQEQQNSKQEQQNSKQEQQNSKQEQQNNKQKQQNIKQEQQSRKQVRQERKRVQQQEQYKRNWLREKTHGLLGLLVSYENGGRAFPDGEFYGRGAFREKDICYTAYDISLEKWLRKEGCTEWWKEYWPYPDFDGYHELTYVEELLTYGHSPHFLILGYDRVVPELILRNIRKMKSLRLILDYLPKDLEGFLEDLYEDYGLAATFQLLPEAQEYPYRSAHIVCSHPSVILDFSGEERILTSGVAKDSVWLDMDSMEEKRRRIEERNTGILYTSLKKHWLQGLDTPIKNRYNTEVN